MSKNAKKSPRLFRSFPHMDLSQLKSFADRLSKSLEFGDLVTLNGPLGAGKTTLVRLILESMEVPLGSRGSPTYPLHHLYLVSIRENAGTLSHLDLYRVKDEGELEERGLVETLFDSTQIILVEWLDRFPGLVKSLENQFGSGGRRIALRIELSMTSAENLRELRWTVLGNSERAQALFDFLSTA